jgi:hypothetical protein
MVMAATGGMSRLFISEDTIMAKRCGCPKGAKKVSGRAASSRRSTASGEPLRSKED